MREENTEEVIPAKHVTDAALTFQRKKKQFRYYTFVCMCTHVCVQRETTISISGTSQTTKKTCPETFSALLITNSAPTL
jgi:hypothetical protein